jgi:hypothetical protein
MLLIAVRNPKAFRSLIFIAAWSSFAHAAVMLVMVIHDARSRGEWLMVVVLWFRVWFGNAIPAEGGIRTITGLLPIHFKPVQALFT